MLAFYKAALAPIGYTVAMEFPSAAGLGEGGKINLWMAVTDKPLRPLHIAFRSNRQRVDAFHAAALAAGGTDNGPPGVRTDYHPHYYAAYVIDPEGNNVEVVCHDPPGAQKQPPARAASPRQARQEVRKPPRKPARKAAKSTRPRSGASRGKGHAAAMSTRPIVAGALMAATIAAARRRERSAAAPVRADRSRMGRDRRRRGRPGVRRHPQPRPVALRDPRLRARLRHLPQRRAGPGRRLRHRGPGLRRVLVRSRGPRQPVAVAEDRIWDDHDDQTARARRSGSRSGPSCRSPTCHTAWAPRACSWSAAASKA